MIRLRSFSIGIIKNNDKVLMMERSMERKFAPGLWTVVGGHIEPNEMNDPAVTCVREIEEETGIKENELDNLRLRFIVIRKSAEEIRIQYVYECSTNQTDVVQSDEGILYWIESGDILNRKLSFTTIEIIKRLKNSRKDRVEVGTVDEVDGKPKMNWNSIEDWDASSFY